MISFALFGYPPAYNWCVLLDIITEHHPLYPRYNDYCADVYAIQEICETQGFDVTLLYDKPRGLEIHFKDPHQELLFKLKYL